MRQFNKLNVSNWELTRVQDNIDLALTPVLTLPLLDGVLLENISLTATQDNYIKHKLGREPRLWIVVRQNANATVWEQTAASSQFINLHTSANCTVSLWVA